MQKSLPGVAERKGSVVQIHAAVAIALLALCRVCRLIRNCDRPDTMTD